MKPFNCANEWALILLKVVTCKLLIYKWYLIYINRIWHLNNMPIKHNQPTSLAKPIWIYFMKCHMYIEYFIRSGLIAFNLLRQTHFELNTTKKIWMSMVASFRKRTDKILWYIFTDEVFYFLALFRFKKKIQFFVSE